MGDAVGHWEGKTLVVETTNLLGDTLAVGVNGDGGAPYSEDMKLTERFTRVSPNTINYSLTVNDPKTYTAPWTVAFPITHEPGYKLFEYACHEGNMAMHNMLSAARMEDKKAAASRQVVADSEESGDELIMRNKLLKGLLGAARDRIAAGCGAGVGASRFRGRVRCEQAAGAEGHGHQDGVDQSARLDSSGREECGWNRDELDDRGRALRTGCCAAGSIRTRCRPGPRSWWKAGRPRTNPLA